MGGTHLWSQRRARAVLRVRLPKSLLVCRPRPQRQILQPIRIRIGGSGVGSPLLQFKSRVNLLRNQYYVERQAEKYMIMF
jgi:hypothetical protein